MEESLTIPRRDLRGTLSKSLAVASVGSLACIGSTQNILKTAYPEDHLGTGSNITWFKTALSEWDCSDPADLFTLSLQRPAGVFGTIESKEVLLTDRDALLYIKDTLSLTGQQLADAMGVSRTALYQWLEGATEMRRKHRERLSALRSLANFWSDKATGGVVNAQALRGAARTELAQYLSANDRAGLEKARALLQNLAEASVPAPEHRSILDIAKDRKWSKRPDHVRRAQVSSRIPSVGPNEKEV